MAYQEKIPLAKEGFVAIGDKAKFLSLDKVDKERAEELKMQIDVYGTGPFLVTDFFKESGSDKYQVFMKGDGGHTLLASSNILQQA